MTPEPSIEGRPSRSKRLEELFYVLKSIRRTVDETHALTERAIKDAPTDRALAEHFLDAATGGDWGKRFPEPPPRRSSLAALTSMVEMILGGGAGVHALYLRLIDERETLAKQLENIRGDLEKVNLEPRTKHVGQKGWAVR